MPRRSDFLSVVLRPLAAACAAFVLCACATNGQPGQRGQTGETSQFLASFDNWLPIITQFGVYKIDINQGNYISQDMVDKLKAGQTKAQVRATLGTPLIVSPFRESRWDYVYEYQRAGKVREHRQFTVYFNDDAVARWEGDEMPPSVQDLNRVASTRALPEDPYGQDAGIVGWIIDLFRKVVDPAAAAVP